MQKPEEANLKAAGGDSLDGPDADAQRLAWLCAEAKIGFDQIARGEYITLNSEADIHEFMDKLLQEVRARRKP